MHPVVYLLKNNRKRRPRKIPENRELPYNIRRLKYDRHK
jgi:hypothetical protein